MGWSSKFEILTTKLPKDRPIIVIGRNVAERVEPFAEQLRQAGFDNVRTYTPEDFRSYTASNPTANPLDLQANYSWIYYWVKVRNAFVVDVGEGNSITPSQFYNIEVKSIYQNWKYPDVIQYTP